MPEKRKERSLASSPLLDGSILARQIRIERSAVADGAARYWKLVAAARQRKQSAMLKPAEQLILHWFEPMIVAIQQEKALVRAGEAALNREVYGPMLWCIDCKRMAIITIRELLNIMLDQYDGFPFSTVAYAIGRGVVAEANVDLIRRSETTSVRELLRSIPGHRRLTNQAINWWAKLKLDDHWFSMHACLALGARLLELLMSVAAIGDYETDVFRPAIHIKLQPRFRGTQKRFKFVIIAHQCLDLVAKGHEARQSLRPVYQPMIVPPYPWSKAAAGGYISIRTPFVSRPSQDLRMAMEHADLDQVYAHLNSLVSTQWEIGRAHV